jgi:hypothetical protein
VQIGIENFKSVPVIAGARLFGKLGANNIGLLNIQTGSASDVASTNNTVVRYKRDIGNQSYVDFCFLYFASAFAHTSTSIKKNRSPKANAN